MRHLIIATCLLTVTAAFAQPTATATLASGPGKTAFLAGYDIQTDLSKAPKVIACTITGTINGPAQDTFHIQGGVQRSLMPQRYSVAVHASGQNVPITVSCNVTGTIVIYGALQ